MAIDALIAKLAIERETLLVQDIRLAECGLLARDPAWLAQAKAIPRPVADLAAQRRARLQVIRRPSRVAPLQRGVAGPRGGRPCRGDPRAPEFAGALFVERARLLDVGLECRFEDAHGACGSALPHG
ncbi:MAG: hypothetical protein U0232_05955 [Thermomicrobiales bacterium]